jgi:hypothetical protein
LALLLARARPQLSFAPDKSPPQFLGNDPGSRAVWRRAMSWQMLVPFVIPLITAVIAYRRTGIQRLIAIVATVAATGHYALALLDAGRFADPRLSGAGLPTYALLPSWTGFDRSILSAVSLSLFAIGFVAILMLMAGKLRHPVQWLAVGIGTLLIATFFVSFWLAIGSAKCQLNLALLHSKSFAALNDCGSAALLIVGISGALLPLAKLLIVDASGAVNDFLKARAELTKPGAARRRWHPAQWLAVGAGAFLFGGVLILVYLHAIAEDPAVMLMTSGVLIGALGPRLVGWLQKRRDQASFTP